MFSTTSNTGYTCNCTSQFLGSICQFPNPCASRPCQNNSTCVAIENDQGYYFCDCPVGFTGDFCQTREACLDNSILCSTLAARGLCSIGSIGTIPLSTYCAKSCGSCKIIFNYIKIIVKLFNIV